MAEEKPTYRTSRFKAVPADPDGYYITSTDPDEEFVYPRYVPDAFAGMAIEILESGFSFGVQTAREAVVKGVPALVEELERTENVETVP